MLRKLLYNSSIKTIVKSKNIILFAMWVSGLPVWVSISQNWHIVFHTLFLYIIEDVFALSSWNDAGRFESFFHTCFPGQETLLCSGERTRKGWGGEREASASSSLPILLRLLFSNRPLCSPPSGRGKKWKFTQELYSYLPTISRGTCLK